MWLDELKIGPNKLSNEPKNVQIEHRSAEILYIEVRESDARGERESMIQT